MLKKGFIIPIIKAKPKAMSVASHKGHRQFSEPIKSRRKLTKLTKVQGNDWFCFTSDLMTKCHKLFKSIMSHSN